MLTKHKFTDIPFLKWSKGKDEYLLATKHTCPLHPIWHNLSMVVEKSIHWKLNHRLSCWKSRAVSNMRKLLASENSNMSPTLFLSMEWPEVHWQKNYRQDSWTFLVLKATLQQSYRLADWWKTDILWVGLQRWNVCLLAFLCNYAIIYLNTRKTLKKMFFLVTGWVPSVYCRFSLKNGFLDLS